MIIPGKALPLTYKGVRDAAVLAGITPETLWSVVHVETSGCGFCRDRRPIILFERHVFYRLTGGEFFPEHDDVCAPSSGGYGNAGVSQYDRLHRAMKLSETFALYSASWGLGQIMGENFARAGYVNVKMMVEDFADSEDKQLCGMAWFIRHRRLAEHLARQDWASFAKGYNGPAYKRNLYDEKLAGAYARFSTRGLPDLLIRARQMQLFFEGRYDGAMDGIVGPRTTSAEARNVG